METQKIKNLLNDSKYENSKFATKKWYIIDNESKGNYSHHNPIKFLTSSLESSLCDYSDAYILVTGNITVTRTIAAAAADVNTQRKKPLAAAIKVIFRNCAPTEDCWTEISDNFDDYANSLNITMPIYNLIEYSDNCSDTSGTLWDFKRDKIDNNANVANDNMLLHFNIKQVFLVILKQMDQKWSKNSCTIKVFK